MVMEYNLINETNVNKKNCLDTNYYFFPPFLHVDLGVVNLLVTLLTLADNSPTAFLADLVFCLM